MPVTGIPLGAYTKVSCLITIHAQHSREQGKPIGLETRLGVHQDPVSNLLHLRIFGPRPRRRVPDLRLFAGSVSIEAVSKGEKWAAYLDVYESGFLDILSSVPRHACETHDLKRSAQVTHVIAQRTIFRVTTVITRDVPGVLDYFNEPARLQMSVGISQKLQWSGMR